MWRWRAVAAFVGGLGVVGGCSGRQVGEGGSAGEGDSEASSAPMSASEVTSEASSDSDATDPTQDSSAEDPSDTSTGDTDDSSGDFVPDAPPPLDNCEPTVQDCPEGQKCVWYVPEGGSRRREAAKCIDVLGDVAPFDPCVLPTGIGPEVSDDCGADSFCLEVYGTADHGFCAPFAISVEGDGCGHVPGSSYATENGSTFPDACLYFECQPFVADSCPQDMRCIYYPAFLYGSMMCWRVPEQQQLPLGEPCEFGTCGAGKLCAEAAWLPACEGERCCAEFCDLGSPSCAEPGTSCELFPVWNYMGGPDFEWLGACVLEGAFEP